MSDKKNISDIYRQYYDELRRYLAHKVRCKEDASEIAQEAFTRVLALSDGYEIRNLRGFLYRTALNLTVDNFRLRQNDPEAIDEASHLDEFPCGNPGPETIACSRQRLRALQEAIAELPPQCRKVFLLHKFDCLTHTEIASNLNISRNMVEKHVIKAMVHLRSRLGRLE